MGLLVALAASCPAFGGTSQSITFDFIADKQTTDAPFPAAAIASSGLAVTFTSLDTVVCTISASTVTLHAGGTCQIAADQAGDGTFDPAPRIVRYFSVFRSPQTIDFPSLPDKTALEPPFTVAATASSGLLVTFSALNPSVCTVTGTTVTLVSAGTCLLGADQPGGPIYLPAPQITRYLNVFKEPQTISFAPIADRSVQSAPFIVSATASSGLAVTFGSLTPTICQVSGATVSMVTSGTCVIAANQPGNATVYAPASQVTQFFNISKLPQTISFPALADHTVLDPSFSVSATASSGLTVTFGALSPSVCLVSGTTVTLQSTGTCVIAADQSGSAIYAPASQVTQFFNVNKVSQTVTFAPLPAKPLGAAPFSISASASSGLPVAFTALDTVVCTVSGSTVTLLAVGTCIIAADQPGNGTYLSAVQVTRWFSVDSVAPAMGVLPASLDFGGQSMNTSAPAQSVAITNTGGGSVTVSSVSASLPFSVIHDCAVLAAGASCTANVAFTPRSEGALAGTLTIAASAGTQTVTLAGTGERSLVTHYYRSILRRAPDAAGKSFWEAEATRVGGLGANVNEVWYAMAQTFYFSAEYAAFNRDDIGFVTDLYNTFFNRPPDGAGLAFWTGQLGSGLPREVALASFMFSTEFATFTQAIFGNTAARAEVNVVMDFYRGLLSRLPDTGGFNFWVQQFRTAQCQGAGAVYAQVESISSSFASGAEYAARNRSNGQYVGDLYNAFLRRGGDLAGVQFWINQLDTAAKSRGRTRQDFLASPEFNGRVNAVISQGCLP